MITSETYDAWMIKPPCERSENNWECNEECPYLLDCWGNEDEEEEE